MPEPIEVRKVPILTVSDASGLAELREHAAAGQFARGSMGPKVDAALRFVEAGGDRAVITSLEHIADAVTSDDAGTVLTAS